MTAQRSLEAELRHNQERYALVAEAANEGLYDWDVETQELYVSPRLNEMFDFGEGPLDSHRWFARVHPDDRDNYRRALVTHFKGQTRRLEVEYRIEIKGHELRWMLDTGIAKRDGAGRVVRLIGAVSDVTEQKGAERRLRESEERYATAMQAVAESIYDWNLENGEVFYSDSVYTSLRLSRQELQTPQDWLKRIHQDDLPAYQQALSDHFAGRTERLHCEYRFHAGDGTLRWARQHGLALRNEAGRVVRVIGSTGDITEQKELGQELEQTRQRLLVSDKLASLGQLTAGVAHEIKNPLNFVNNFAQLSVDLLDELQDELLPLRQGLDEEQQESLADIVAMLTDNLNKIVEHGGRADNIVKSMLLHSREGAAESREVEVKDLVEEALGLAYHGARAKDREFNVSLERHHDSAALPLEVMPQELTRVLLNLIGNGFHAIHKKKLEGGDPEYEPTLRVETKDHGDKMEITVHDNGPGIPTDVQEKIFEPFFTTKSTGEGTGLGLSISHDIVVQQHAGELAVESEPGAFTRFCITLPRSCAAADKP